MTATLKLHIRLFTVMCAGFVERPGLFMLSAIRYHKQAVHKALCKTLQKEISSEQ